MLRDSDTHHYLALWVTQLPKATLQERLEMELSDSESSSLKSFCLGQIYQWFPIALEAGKAWEEHACPRPFETLTFIRPLLPPCQDPGTVQST